MAATEGIQPLPVLFDLSCPIALPERPALVQWPWPIAGPSTSGEDAAAFVRRRYLETLYVGSPIFPLSGLAADLARIDAASLAPLLGQYQLDLPAVEAKHRTRLLPILRAAVSGADTTEVLAEAGLENDEAETLLAGVGMRTKSRAAVEGTRIVTAKAVAEEYEQNEVLIQVLLHLFRRRAERLSDNLTNDAEADKKVATQLELLADRIGVWQAVAELGIGLDLDPPTNSKEETESGIQLKLKEYWQQCLVPHFLPSEATYLATWHHKVFGVPMPAELMPVKKPRKPKVTRRLSVERAEPMARSDSASSRKRGRDGVAISATRESASATGAGGVRERGRESQTHSRRSSLDRRESLADRRESLPGERNFRRSASVMSTTSDRGDRDKERRIVRAPSGRDIFKGREIGVLKRTSSQKIQRAQSLSTTGLLGRRVDPESQSQSQSASLSASTSGARAESQSQSQSRAGGREYRRTQSQREVTDKDPKTLVYATPSKPKHKMFAFAHPTPIREEPSSGSKPYEPYGSYDFTGEMYGDGDGEGHGFVAETPTTTRIAVVAETPSVRAMVAETPVSTRIAVVAETPSCVAESPLSARIASTPLSARLAAVSSTPRRRIALTTVTEVETFETVVETPARSQRSHRYDETPSRSTGRYAGRRPLESDSPTRGLGSDDDLEALMVMTDDEGEGPESPLGRH